MNAARREGWLLSVAVYMILPVTDEGEGVLKASYLPDLYLIGL